MRLHKYSTTPMDGLLIKNGQVVDPLNAERFVRRNVHVRNGKISGAPANTPLVIDAENCVVMAGGIDVHTHVADYSLNGDAAVRTRMTSTGLRYAQMGYTTIIEPASPLALASVTKERMEMIPQVDKGSLALLGAWEPLLRFIERGKDKDIAELVSWIARKAGAYSVKLVNPGGKFLKNSGGSSAMRRLEGFDLTPMDVANAIARAVETSGLPCPVQLHLNDLGEPWSHTSAIETIKGLGETRAHLAHLQFHCYGGRGGFSSEAGLV
ncbi:MAG: amidohydrolase family protein, partial [Nitrospinae bacterium]|nr:amidohydrolase family protein [Nitrospinota bacterium]